MTEAASAVGRPADGTVTRNILPRGLIILLGLASLVVALAGVRSIAWLVGPVFLALILVIALAPVQTWMRRRGWPGWLSTLVLILLVYAVLLAMIASIVVSIARLATEMPQYANQAQHYVTAATNLLAKYGVGPEQLQSLAGQLNWGKIAQFVGSLLDGISGIATSIVFLLALLLFLSVETTGVAWRLAAVGVRPQVSAALSQFAVATRTYLVVTTVFGLIVAVLDTVALWIIGVPLAITWGLLSFITNYVPNIGFILGLIPPALLGLVSGGWQTALAVIVVYCVLNLIVQSIIQPRFVGDSVGLSVTVTFVALLVRDLAHRAHRSDLGHSAHAVGEGATRRRGPSGRMGRGLPAGQTGRSGQSRQPGEGGPQRDRARRGRPGSALTILRHPVAPPGRRCAGPARRGPPVLRRHLEHGRHHTGETYRDLATGFGIGTTTVYRYLREALELLGRDGAIAGAGDRGRPREGLRHPRRHLAADRPGRHDHRPGPALLLRQTQVPRGERAGHRRPGRTADLGLTGAARRAARHGRRPRARHHRRAQHRRGRTRSPTPPTRAAARRCGCRSVAVASIPTPAATGRCRAARRRSTPRTPASAAPANGPTPS